MKSLIIFSIFIFIPAMSGDFNHLKLKTSFEENYDRYPPPQGMFLHLKRILPFLDYTLKTECTGFNDDNVMVMGNIIPQYGQPVEPQPGSFFSELYAECLEEALQKSLAPLWIYSKKNFQTILGLDLYQEVLKIKPEEIIQEIRWSDLPSNLQDQIMDRLILYLIGPEPILRHFKYIGPKNVFGQNLNSSKDLANFIVKNLFESRMTTMLDVVKHTTLLLRVGPILRN